MTLLQGLLNDVAADGRTVSLYQRQDRSFQYPGQIVAVADGALVLKRYRLNGSFQAYMWMRAEDIGIVCYNRPAYTTIAETADLGRSLPIELSRLDLTDLLDRLRVARCAVTLEDRDDGEIMGFVLETDLEFAVIQTVNDNFQIEGKELLRLEDVNLVEFGGIDQHRLETNVPSVFR
jgi:hypothetical protein